MGVKSGWLYLALLTVLACGEGVGANPTIDVLDDEFSPEKITVQVGSTITWVWNGVHEHQVIVSLPAGDESSDTQDEGQFEKTFSRSGVYRFHCGLHNGMAGTITVE